jgi:hypothetical protein
MGFLLLSYGSRAKQNTSHSLSRAGFVSANSFSALTGKFHFQTVQLMGKGHLLLQKSGLHASGQNIKKGKYHAYEIPAE